MRQLFGNLFLFTNLYGYSLYSFANRALEKIEMFVKIFLKEANWKVIKSKYALHQKNELNFWLSYAVSTQAMKLPRPSYFEFIIKNFFLLLLF